MQTVELVHAWTNETVHARVERMTVKKVTIRFSIVGSSTYDLDIKTNVMRSTSAAVRRKHPCCLWRAKDIDAVRRAVWIHFHPEHEQVNKSVERHMQNMPHAKLTANE